MRLTRCALAAATVAACASAVAVPFVATHFTSPGSGVEHVRMVSALGAERIRAESPEPSPVDPSPQTPPAPPCRSYGGPYCGWVRAYHGGCDWVWGLSYGIKDPDFLCPHDPRPSPSAAASSSASPSPSGATSSGSGGSVIGGTTAGSTGSGGTTSGGTTGSGGTTTGGGTSAGIGGLAGRKHKSPAEPHHSATPRPAAAPGDTAPAPGATVTAAPAPSPAGDPGGVYAPGVIDPQVLPGGEESPFTARLLHAVGTALEHYLFPFSE
ncbi:MULTISPECIES: hypothetical protein [unclassified Streptomyces]|uniref:hypothetical protein n=1 Tax=unclassified Streptomyces TaxID=2593676 RepID=UPI004041242C